MITTGISIIVALQAGKFVWIPVKINVGKVNSYNSYKFKNKPKLINMLPFFG